MRNIIAVSVTAVLLLFVVPVLLINLEEDDGTWNACFIIEAPAMEQKDGESSMIRLITEEGVQELLLEDYLVSVVLSEMPPSFEIEALKAQTVAARTFAMRQMSGGKHKEGDLCNSSACCQAWKTEDALAECYGDEYDRYRQKIRQAVESTAGEVLIYDGELIDAVYFSCSGGTTENAVEVWGSEVPYLQSVPSIGEQASKQYLTSKEIEMDAFCKTLRQENSAIRLEGQPASWFGEITRTEGGGVKEIIIGGVSFTGTRLRTLFGLNSTKFTIEIGDTIGFVVSGYGHRVGMSQYGANALAKQGKSYEEILLHYYSGVKLHRKNP